MTSCSKKILVCMTGKTCSKRHNDDILAALRKAIAKRELDEFFKIEKTSCLGFCKSGPTIQIKPDKCTYGYLVKDDCKQIIKHHAKKKKPIKSLSISKKKK